jgi:2-methylcitrate dehydratase PrpD
MNKDSKVGIDFQGALPFVESFYDDAAVPASVAEAARRCFVDWFASGLSGLADVSSRPFLEMAESSANSRAAQLLDGRRTTAQSAALVNGVLAHTTDFDDFHPGSVFHAGAPTIAAIWALGTERGVSGARMLAALIAGFEVGASCGLHGRGLRMANRGWHPSSILGHVSAAVSCAVLLRLPRDGIRAAIAHSIVQAGGLMSSAGSMAKALIVGKAAASAILAVRMAEAGVIASNAMLEDGPSGLFSALLGEEERPDFSELGSVWQIERNTFKPYPACQLAHPVYDVAHQMAGKVDVERIRSVKVRVNPFALTIAKHWMPETPLQSRFSLNHCVALGLLGYSADESDFSAERLHDPAVARLRPLVRGEADQSIERWAAALEIELDDGRQLNEYVHAATGSLGRPMLWPDLERKFLSVASPRFGGEAKQLYEAIQQIDAPGAVDWVTSGLSSAVRPQA